jgi:hypothetical protein
MTVVSLADDLNVAIAHDAIFHHIPSVRCSALSV